MKNIEGTLPQWLTHHVPPWRSFILYLAKCRVHSAHEIDSKHLQLDTWQEIKDPPEGGETQPVGFQHITRINRFFDGLELISKRLWPWLFYSLFGYDIYNYVRFTDNHYRLTFSDFFFGIPRNYDYRNASLSINLGGDLPELLNYWPWIAVSAPVLTGLLFLLNSTCYKTGNYKALYSLKEQLIAKEYKDPENKTDRAALGIYEGYGSTSLPVLSETTIAEIESILNYATAKEYHFWVKLLAISTLADIYYYRKYQPSSPDEDKIRKYVFLDGLAHLYRQKYDWGFKNFLPKMYTLYQIWAIGKSEELPRRPRIAINLLSYCVLYPLQLYPLIRLYSLIVNKIIKWVEHKNKLQDCEAKGKSWREVEIGDYACIYDWSTTYLRASDDQSALDELLGSPRDPKYIAAKLPILTGPIQSVSFYKQPWPQWPLSDWQQILTQLQSSPYHQIRILNFSLPAPNPEAIPYDYIKTIGDFLQSYPAPIVDFTNVTFSQQSVSGLAPGFVNNNVTMTVNFTQSELTDDVASTLIPIIPPYLKTLCLRQNQLTQATLLKLDNTSVTDLDVSGNYFTPQSIEAFSRSINATQLKTLTISDTNFSSVNMTEFGKNIRSLTTIVMSNCQLRDQQSAALFPQWIGSSILSVDWSKNGIGYGGLKIMSADLPSTDIQYLYLDDNLIDDSGIILLSPAISTPNSSLIGLSLSGNLFGPQGFSQFVISLPFSTIQFFQAARTNIGDSGIQAFIASVADSDQFKKLDFHHINLTEKGATNLFYFLVGKSLISLDLSGNLIAAAAGMPLNTLLSGGYLQELFLSESQINSSILQEGLRGLPDSQVRSLRLCFNPLDDDGGSYIAKLLIKKVPNQNKWLSTTEADKDFERAVDDTENATTLTFLDLTGTQIGDVGKQAVRLVQLRGGLTYSNVWLDDTNATDSKMAHKPSAAFSAEQLNVNIFLWLVIAVCLFRSEKLWNFVNSILGVLSKLDLFHRKTPVLIKPPKLSELPMSLLPSPAAKVRETVHEKISIPYSHR